MRKYATYHAFRNLVLQMFTCHVSSERAFKNVIFYCVEIIEITDCNFFFLKSERGQVPSHPFGSFVTMPPLQTRGKIIKIILSHIT